MKLILVMTLIPCATIATAGVAQAQEANSDLAKKLSNPVASLISVPFQFNCDHGFGPNDGNRETLNIQPVIPVSINEN